MVRQNRIIDEREKTRDHYLHVSRLMSIKPSVDVKKPVKPTCIKNKLKKELLTQSKYTIIKYMSLVKSSEIQHENRLLLKKMLQIDLKPQNLNPKRLLQQDQYFVTQNSQQRIGINSYHSLNRAIRIKDMANVVDHNKILLKKLQQTNSFYNFNEYEKDNKNKKKLSRMISKNSDRFCKNPYFLHSMATTNISTYNIQTMDPESIKGGKKSFFSSSRKRSSNRTLEINMSANDMNLGEKTSAPRLPKQKRIRPMSAPKYGFSNLNGFRLRTRYDSNDLGKIKSQTYGQGRFSESNTLPYIENDPYSVGGGTIINLQDDNQHANHQLNIISEGENEGPAGVYDQININLPSNQDGRGYPINNYMQIESNNLQEVDPNELNDNENLVSDIQNQNI
ncbi:UNKNOWN [Stylonychia lemnae]|uniref:Uncharacterized protein n=1 Tax=Stylonychia lemnae TaxID=5949 RepID=A0A077ZQY4_STYLE|nr:UNKNOWN [Stylonychia lemnae]|eukprot:CDW72308.1 UNKNOWN [Stylonychia lemnae]